MRKRLFILLTAGFTLLFLLGGFLFIDTAHAKSTSVHVHVQGETELVESLTIIYKGEPYELTTNNGKLYSLKKKELADDIVKPDISEIVVTMNDGSVKTYSPAIDYAGVEGKGTINYWIEVSANVSEEEPPAEEDPVEDSEPPAEDPVEESDKPAEDDPVENSDGTVENDQNQENESDQPTTVTGGELPATSSPWVNNLIVSGIIAACAGASYIALRKITK